MVWRLNTAALVTILLYVVSGTFVPDCQGASRCPSDMPCCSRYGQCGTGVACLLGCQPASSFSLDSCEPEPICQDRTTTFQDAKSLVGVDAYLGDPSVADFVSYGQTPLEDGTLFLTLDPGLPIGSAVSSTTYIWYGKTSVRLRTSRGSGVVTSFGLLWDLTQDEVSFHFIGSDLGSVQTQYGPQAMPEHDFISRADSPVYIYDTPAFPGDTFADFHDYEIDWQLDRIEWSVNGMLVRSLLKTETWNESTNEFDFPQTPARVLISLWPGGLSTNPKTTIEWAGGEIDWNGRDIETVGYFYAQVQQVTIGCSSPPSGANISGHTSYIYTSTSGLEDSIAITDKGTTIAS